MTRKFQVGGRNPRGAFDFGTNSNNLFDSKDGFSNALLGNFNTYSEGTARVNGDWRFQNFEFYVQDNWRVSRRLTLDFGMRFYHIPPQTDDNQTIATFDPNYFKTSAIPVLYMPTLENGKRVAVDPRTGKTYPNPYIGLFVPNTGEPANGGKTGGVDGYPAGLYTVNSLYLAPRFGFAYDVFGTGKTAIRGGFGMFQDRMQGNPTMDTNGNPPVSYAPTSYFGSLDTYANSGGMIGPSSLSALLGKQNPTTTMNWSLGIQQQVKATAIDVSYVGSSAYHLLAQLNINPIPIGARFNKANEDPSQPGRPLPDNYFRRYLGWQDINLRTAGYNYNYNSLQAQANRRFAKGLQMGISYTFSKTLGVADGDTSGVSPYFSPKSRNYGQLAYDRPHVFVSNFYYDLPAFGKMMGSKPAGWFLDNWNLSGIWTVSSGSPYTPGLGWTTSTEVTGSTEGARVNIVGSCAGPKDFYQWFNTAHGGASGNRQMGRPQRDDGELRQRGRQRLPQSRDEQLGPRGRQARSDLEGRPLHPVPDRAVQRLQPHAVLGTRHRDAVQPHDGSAEQPDLRTRHRRPRAEGDRALDAYRVLIVSLARAGQPALASCPTFPFFPFPIANRGNPRGDTVR